MSPAIKHHLSGPQIRMGQGDIPKVHLSGLHDIKVILSVTIPYSILRTSDFPFAAKKTATYCHSHQCKLHNYKCSEQIFILIQGGYEVTSCSSMEPNMGTPKLTDIQTRCSVFATHISGKRREIW